MLAQNVFFQACLFSAKVSALPSSRSQLRTGIQYAIQRAREDELVRVCFNIKKQVMVQQMQRAAMDPTGSSPVQAFLHGNRDDGVTGTISFGTSLPAWQQKQTRPAFVPLREPLTDRQAKRRREVRARRTASKSKKANGREDGGPSKKEIKHVRYTGDFTRAG